MIAIGDFIARDNPPRAIMFIKELTQKCAALADMLLAHPLVPRYEEKGLRRRVHGAYQIFFRVDGELIHIIRVLHGARDYDALL